VCSLAAVVVPLLDFAFDGKAPTRKSLLACALALAGVSLLEGGAPPPPPTPARFTNQHPRCIGGGCWRKEKAMAAFPGDALRLTAAQLQAVAAVAGGYLLLGPGQVPGAAQVLEWLQTPPLLVRKRRAQKGGGAGRGAGGGERRAADFLAQEGGGASERGPACERALVLARSPACSLARALARSGILSHAPNC
jgi:hypothetical protein